MKALLWLSGIVVTVAAFVGAGRLWAEADDNKPAAPRTRIGLVNLAAVIKDYHKYKTFQDDMRGFVEPFARKDAQLRKKLEKLRAEAETLSNESSNGEVTAEVVQAKKDAIEQKAKQLQRELEDNSIEAKRKLGKRNDDEMKVLYMDVYEAGRQYAKSHDLDAVFHYNDTIKRKEYYSVKFISNKMNSNGLIVATSRPGLDISKDIANLLNYGPPKKP